MTLKPYGLMADLHLHAWSSFSSVGPDGINTRLVGLLGEIHRCAQEVKKRGGDTLVMAGDVFHVRGSVAPSVLNPTRDMLEFISGELGTKFIILPGNHDLEGKNTTRIGSAVTALESRWVTVVNRPRYFADIQAVLFPWFDSVDELKKRLEDEQSSAHPADHESCDAIIHAPIDGVITGLPSHGLSPEYLAGLSFNAVYSGHYHNYKAFDGNVVSIGALAHHTWSDVGSKAGFLIVEPGKGHTWFSSHLPSFIDLNKLSAEEREDIDLIVDGNFVRIRVEAAKSKDVEEAKAELTKMGAKAVLVQAEPKPPADMERKAHTVEAGASLEVSVVDFIKSMKVIPDAEEVKREAMSVLGSVVATH